MKPCPALPEIKALAELLSTYPRARAWFSFTLRDAQHLSDGTPLREVISILANYPQIVALGINCIALEETTAALEHLHSLTRCRWWSTPTPASIMTREQNLASPRRSV